VTYSLAEDGRKGLLALLPEKGGVQHPARYKLRELVAEPGGSAGGKILEEADDATAVRWVSRGGAGGRDFAGRSTELVGLDGRYPVMWDRSAGRVEWLEPID
jgi:hypothetical protein